MQEMGLEPTRYCYHRHLKPARLPIPPFLHASDIVSVFLVSVNPFLHIFIYFYYLPADSVFGIPK